MTQPNTLQNRALLLIISGGIAAYKCLDLIRRLRDEGARVRCVLTEGGSKFVTPMSVTALSGQEVALDMWGESGSRPLDHIRLSRESDLVVVAPATANLMAKMAQGLADDLASTVLLASDKPVMIAPAMNGAMWKNAATQANVATLRSRGIRFIGPATGAMACGEEGEGRMVESAEILEAVRAHFSAPGPLAGLRALVTSGPTFEPLDPVRFLGNRSSGKQGYAIATALARAGADVLLVTGPTALMEPVGVKTLRVETAREMLEACENVLPFDVFVGAAAVADWRPANEAEDKLKKGTADVRIDLVENPDILATLSRAGAKRPCLVIGFAAETDHVEEQATEKLKRKGCDWLLANEVGAGKGFGEVENAITLLRREAQGRVVTTPWPRQSKEAIARKLVEEIVRAFRK